MIEAHEGVISAAMALPAEARAELAERLLDSLDGPEQTEVDAAWSEEAERRIEQLDRGEATVIPGQAVMAKLRAICK